MYNLLTTAQIRDLEDSAVHEQGITEKRLMLDAGTAVADFVEGNSYQMPAAVICGPGKNGGDGWVAARVLHSRGNKVTVYTTQHPKSAKGLLAEIIYEATSAGVHWEYWEVSPGPDVFNTYGVLVDAILGIGCRIPLGSAPGELGYWGRMMNQSRSPVVAVDVPTGVSGDNGNVDENAVLAEATVTMLAAKVGLALAPAARHTGDVIVADLGVTTDSLQTLYDMPAVYVDQEYALQMPLPAFDANKYSRGRALIIAGSRAYPGAAVMAALAACRCGAGYVQLAVPAGIAPLVRTHLLTAPVIELPETREGLINGPKALEMLMELSAQADSVLIGPGLGRDERLLEMVRRLVLDRCSAVTDVPLVLDADALAAFEGHPERLLVTMTGRQMVVTPHSGEAARLLGRSLSAHEALSQVLSLAKELSGPLVTCVFKGPSTVIASPFGTIIDGQGPPTLATAGTGDVLAGMIVSLLTQGMEPRIAAALAVRLQAHSAALATEDLTPLSVTALDVIDNIPDAARTLMQSLRQDYA
ncbi:MAG: NAD(P)H-hydrate dehydratase [Coriobacteriia bacterium]|nr:NAD(P)H-hydrate dehydratase [Coriobacteriia bacterium]